MRIADLANPLDGTFDLLQCGDSGKYLSIATGYRKEKKAENANKVEIWLAPKFLIEREQATTAKHYAPIIQGWASHCMVGFFFNWGGWDDLGWYDYLTDRTLEQVSSNLFELATKAQAAGTRLSTTCTENPGGHACSRPCPGAIPRAYPRHRSDVTNSKSSKNFMLIL